MAEKPANPAEFRRYRQGLLVAYVVLGGLAGLLIAASVIVDLFFSGTKRAGGAPAAAVDLVRCNQDVSGLLDRVGAGAAELQLEAVRGDRAGRAARVQASVERWQDDWRAVGGRCAFDDASAGVPGTAFERMAWVHRNLPALAGKSREMMARFDEEQAREMARMREALQRSRAELQME